MFILPLQTIIPSRQNSPVVQVALIVILGIVLLIAGRYLYFYLKKSVQEAEKKGTQKKINTSLLTTTAKRLGFEKHEIRFLINVCKKNNILNLPLILETEHCIETPFKKMYLSICENLENLSVAELEDKKLYLFMLIHKLENAKKNLSLLTSTIAFPVGAPIAYITKDERHNHSIIIESTNEEMFLGVAQNSYGNSVKPTPLSKISLYLELKGGIAYQAKTRVVRYQIRSTLEEMVVTHSNDIKFFQRRKHRRMETSLPCAFSAVKLVSDANDGRNKTYLPQGKSYKGEITDLSASGCRLRTSLPIHAGQYMQIEVLLSQEHPDSMSAIVVKSGKDSTGKWCMLNMRFVKMSKRTRNNIFSIVYKYSRQPNKIL